MHTTIPTIHAPCFVHRLYISLIYFCFALFETVIFNQDKSMLWSSVFVVIYFVLLNLVKTLNIKPLYQTANREYFSDIQWHLEI